MFSNKPSMIRKTKYVLDKNYRVHLGSRDEAYKCIWYGPDAEGNNGIYLGKDVVNEASRALSLAMRKVAPSILTYGQIAKYAATEVQRKLSSSKVAAYKPRFTECLEHFLIHAGAQTTSCRAGQVLKHQWQAWRDGALAVKHVILVLQQPGVHDGTV